MRKLFFGLVPTSLERNWNLSSSAALCRF